jgi:hypothetical protein
MIKNDLFLRALKEKQCARQFDDASSRKILPEFIALRDKYDFSRVVKRQN